MCTFTWLYVFLFSFCCFLIRTFPRVHALHNVDWNHGLVLQWFLGRVSVSNISLTVHYHRYYRHERVTWIVASPLESHHDAADLAEHKGLAPDMTYPHRRSGVGIIVMCYGLIAQTISIAKYQE